MCSKNAPLVLKGFTYEVGISGMSTMVPSCMKAQSLADSDSGVISGSTDVLFGAMHGESRWRV